ncbi:MAG: DUF58 domain-containing protein [Polyangiaceae bacterium]|nr:DUF58 domain-containing protein [Polyangiaceae bacterium]
MIPSRAFVLLAVGPVLLSLATLADKSLLWPMLGLDGAIVFLALVDMLLARKRLVHVDRRSPRVMSIGKPNNVELEIRSYASRKLNIEIAQDLFQGAASDDLPLKVTLTSKGRARVKYRVTPGRRGAYELGDHFVRYHSPLGMWIRQLRIPQRTFVKVYPDIQAVRAFELQAMKDRDVAGVRASRRRGGESEFERLREYRREDEFRAIDWKATARNSKLIAREYQLERNQNVLFLLDAGRLMTAEAQGLSLFDHALNATLMLSHVAARAGDQVGLLAFSDDVKSYAPCAGGTSAASRIVQAAYHLHPDITETNFAAAIEQVGFRVKKRTLIVLFTQVVDDVAAAELLRLMRGLLPRHLPLLVPFRDIEIDALALGQTEETTTATGSGPFVRAAAAELVSFRDKLVRELKRRGAHVLDCTPGELTPALINRYLEIKARHLL